MDANFNAIQVRIAATGTIEDFSIHAIIRFLSQVNYCHGAKQFEVKKNAMLVS